MRTLQEKYNAIQEGKFSKEHFLAEARMQQPQLVTRFNGYDDAVQILKNKGMIKEAVVEEVKQPKATKKGLADYRYKPTNEMDKYPYEQILRGLRVELEGLGVQGTPTAEQYAKALATVSKNLAKDSIFYTNQVAGVNPKVDLHDKMITATAKNTVDTFNGMKKAELKEGFKKLIKKVLSENMGDMFGDKEREERRSNYGQPGEHEYDNHDIENYKDEDEMYEMYGEDTVDESAMGEVYQIAQEYDRFEDFVKAVEDEFGPVEDIAELEYIFNSTRGEDDIDFGDENFSDAEIDTEYESPSDRMYNSDAWVQAQQDMMETRKAKSLSELLK